LQAKATARDESAAVTEAKRQEAETCVVFVIAQSASFLFQFLTLVVLQVRGAHQAAGGAEDGSGGRRQRSRHRESHVRAAFDVVFAFVALP
jgi:hypothetical protein